MEGPRNQESCERPRHRPSPERVIACLVSPKEHQAFVTMYKEFCEKNPVDDSADKKQKIRQIQRYLLENRELIVKKFEGTLFAAPDCFPNAFRVLVLAHSVGINTYLVRSTHYTSRDHVFLEGEDGSPISTTPGIYARPEEHAMSLTHIRLFNTAYQFFLRSDKPKSAACFCCK